MNGRSLKIQLIEKEEGVFTTALFFLFEKVAGLRLRKIWEEHRDLQSAESARYGQRLLRMLGRSIPADDHERRTFCSWRLSSTMARERYGGAIRGAVAPRIPIASALGFLWAGRFPPGCPRDELVDRRSAAKLHEITGCGRPRLSSTMARLSSRRMAPPALTGLAKLVRTPGSGSSSATIR